MPESPPKILLVEDEDHVAVASNLMRQVVDPWKNANGYVVEMKRLNSYTSVLNVDVIHTFSKIPNIEALGVVVDADNQIDSRWSRIRAFCGDRFGVLQDTFPSDGLIVSDERGFRFGAWIMPDNSSPGTVETFCKTMLPNQASPLWQCAVNAAESAKSATGAPWRDVHRDRAHLLTWLAWQDPPNGQMGRAIIRHALSHEAGLAPSFISWFRKLFQV